jgi:hypothetical protein
VTPKNIASKIQYAAVSSSISSVATHFLSGSTHCVVVYAAVKRASKIVSGAFNAAAFCGLWCHSSTDFVVCAVAAVIHNFEFQSSF